MARPSCLKVRIGRDRGGVVPTRMSPGQTAPPGAHPLSGLLIHSPSSWLSLCLTAKAAKSLPTDFTQHLQREDLVPEARMATGWGQTGDPSQVILGQLLGSRMRTG